MARRRTSSEGGVSLFPFMSILACLIGILTLLISVTMQVKNLDRKEGQTEEAVQLLSEKRVNPPLQEQVGRLKKFAGESGCIIVFICQHRGSCNRRCRWLSSRFGAWLWGR